MQTQTITNNPNDVLASAIKSAVQEGISEVTQKVDGAIQEIKNFQDFQKALTEAEVKIEAKSLERVKGIEMELDALKQKEKKSVSSMNHNESNVLDSPEVKDFLTKSFESGAKQPLDHMVYKSLVSYNNTSAGALRNPLPIIGTLDVNVATRNSLSSFVTALTTSSIDGVAYKTIDMSVLPPKHVLEGMTTAQKTDLIKRGEVKIMPAEYKAWNYISRRTIDGYKQGNYIENPLTMEFQALDRALIKDFERDILIGSSASDGVHGIFVEAQKSGTKIKKVPTEASNILTLRDISLLTSKLKKPYLDNSVIVIDRQAFHELYNEPAQDGHLKVEYFDYIDGMGAFRSGEKLMKFITVDSFDNTVPAEEHNGFANYKSFVNPSLTIDSGYIVGGANSGKVYAFVADLASAYVLTRNVTKFTHFDDTDATALDGISKYGIRDYIGGKVKLQEAIVIGYIA